MDQPALGPLKAFVRDLREGQAVDCVFLVRDRERRERRSGEPFLKLQLGDTTGVVEAVMWEGIEEALAVARPGSVLRVSGRYGVDRRYGALLTLRSLRAATPGEFDPADLFKGPLRAYEQMEADLESLVATVQQPALRLLLEGLLGAETETGRRWREAPAAKRYHQAYRHGLLEHSLSVAEGVSAVSSTFGGLDRDLAVAGALLHDLGKVEAYAQEGGAIDLTDAGRLQGEIALGYYLVRRAIEGVPGFPAETAQGLLHILLSHHGQLEHGSPVVPCTREATLVHMMDNLGGRLGSFDRIEKGLPGGERWSGFDRALSGQAYFAPREGERAAA